MLVDIATWSISQPATLVMTKRKAIISRRRCIIEAKYLLTTESILNELIESEKMTKKRETREIKRRKAGQVKW